MGYISKKVAAYGQFVLVNNMIRVQGKIENQYLDKKNKLILRS